MKKEFLRALLGLLLAQLALGFGAAWDLAEPQMRELAFRAQLLSSANLLALFALSKSLVEFAAAPDLSARRSKVPWLVFWGVLKLVFLVGLILFLSLQKSVSPRAVLWGISPWALGPLGVALVRWSEALRFRSMK